MSKFKVGDVVKRKDGLPLGEEIRGDVVSETAVVNKVSDGLVYLRGLSGAYDYRFLQLVVNSPVSETIIVKKEIVPGTYGDVEICPAGTICVPGISGTDKKRLAEAIKTLQIIHDATVEQWG